MKHISRKELGILFLLFSIGNLVSLWVLDYFPSVDGPAHVSLVHVWINYDNPGLSLYREFFEKASLNRPNMLIYLILYFLMLVFPPFVSEKLLLSIFVVGLPYAVWYMTSSRGSKGGVVALLSFPLVYNYITYFGFYNFLFGTILYCLSIGFWLRHKDEFSFRSILILALLMLASYYTHLSSAAFILCSIFLLLSGEFLVLYISSKRGAHAIHDKDISLWFRNSGVLVVSALPVVILMINFYLTVLH